MNSWQMALEVRHKLRTLAWPDGASELAFGEEGAYVVAGMPEEDALPGGFPFAYIFAGGGTSDPDEPHYETIPITVAIVQMQEGDPLGEQAIVGGPRRGQEIGTSRGRGALELSSLVQTALGALTGADGLPVVWTNTGAVQAASLGGLMHLATVSLSFRALCTTFWRGDPPHNLLVSGTTASWAASRMSHGFVAYRVLADGVEVGRTTDLTMTSAEIGAASRVEVHAGYSLVAGSEVQVWSEAVARG